MRTFLVTGANGLLGSRLVSVLSSKYEVIPTHNRQPLQPDSVRLNVTDGSTVSKVISDLRPDIIIHAAANTNVDRCEIEKEEAWKINAEGTRKVAEACATIGAKLVYLSTDYVFDGNKGQYREEDSPNPINYYGVTKLKGEEYVKQICDDSIVARTSVIYGWHPRKLNFATWIIDSLKRGMAIAVVTDHYNSPTFADDLARIILAMIEKDLGGIYHTAGGARMSRYRFATRVADIFGLDKSLIKPTKMSDLKIWDARRPRDSSLCIERARREAGVDPLLLNGALEMMKNTVSAT